MNGPNFALMQFYGTRDVYQQKLANDMDLLRMGGRAMGGIAHQQAMSSMNDRQRQEAEAMNAMSREVELARVDQAASLLRYTPQPQFPPGWNDHSVPQGGGWDEGMTRLASIAAMTGADFAQLEKDAGMLDTAASALKGVAGKASTLKNSLGATGRLTRAAAGAEGAVAGAVKPGLFSTANSRFLASGRELGAIAPAAPSALSQAATRAQGAVGQAATKAQGALQSVTPAGRASARMEAAGLQHEAALRAPAVPGQLGGAAVRPPPPTINPGGAAAAGPYRAPGQVAPASVQQAATAAPAAAAKVDPTLAQKAQGRFGLGWKGNLALGGAAVGSVYLGGKAISGASRLMGAEPAEAPQYGNYAPGTARPMTPNQYGYVN